MSYVKTKWYDNQTPLSAGNLNNIEDGIEAVPVDASVGRSSIVTKTVNIETDVDSHGNPIDRTNRVYGAFSSAFGSRNIIDAIASESGVVGGLNEDYGQDNLMFGYRCKSYANQNLTGGYRVINKASESSAIGGNINIDGTITEDDEGNPKSDSKYLSVGGRLIDIGVGAEDVFVHGSDIMNGLIDGSRAGPSGLKHSTIIGTSHRIGNNNKWLTAIGDTIKTDDNIQDSVFIGYNHKGKNSTANEYHYIYELGRDCTNVGSDDTEHQNVYMIGEGLRPSEDDQIIVGGYNGDYDHCWLNVGCGYKNKDTGAITRRSVFGACQQGNNYWIMIGTTRLNKPSSGGTISTEEYVTSAISSVVGDINSALDAINGTVI